MKTKPFNTESEYNYVIRILKDGNWIDLCYSDDLLNAIGRATTELIDYNTNSRVVNQKTNFVIAELKEEQK